MGESGAITVAVLPIRVRETVGAHGRARRSLTVFCPRRAKSLRLRECAHCPRLLDGTDTELRCTPDAPEAFVGSAMSTRALCVRVDARAAEYERPFTASRQWVLPVVDVAACVVGVVWRQDMRERPSRPGGALGAALGAEERAAEVMDARDLTVPEDASVTAAAERMRAMRTRALVVTSATRPGVVVGVVTDLELLRWVAKSHVAA